jgi:hypothetical protein
VGPQHLEAQLKGLKALTNYTVEVKAINQAYESPSSLTIGFSTPEGSKFFQLAYKTNKIIAKQKSVLTHQFIKPLIQPPNF